MDLLAHLNQPQQQAVLHTEGPLLILAGASVVHTPLCLFITIYS
jgi:DNA helicase-2/ATP-dependent DNA helicase PcrA